MRVDEQREVEAAEVLAHRLGGRGAQQVGEHLGLAALLAGLELDLAAEHVDRGLEVDDPGDRLVLALRGGAVQRGRRDRLGAGDREPGADARALVDRAGLAQVAGEPGQDLDEVVRHLGDQVGLLPDHGDLVLELGRVVGADLRAEPVLERGDDPAAVGVVLRVGAGDDEHVERQPQHVAADLDVALLHHVEHRDLDPLGEVGQLVDRDDAAVAARDQPEVDRLRVAQRAALGDLHRVDVADQVGDAGVGGRELLGVPLVAVPPLDRQVVAELGRAALRLVGDRLVGVLAELGARDHRRPLVEQADQRAQQPGLALAALAEQHHVVAGDQRPLELRDDGVLEAVQPGPRVAALAQRGEQVVAHLGAQGLWPRGRTRGARRRCRRRAERWEQKSLPHATQRDNNWTASPVRSSYVVPVTTRATLGGDGGLPVRLRTSGTTRAAAGCTAAPPRRRPPRS